ncbi:hypothetical protein SAMD00019534_090080 [Acytostelium subglobosum LB1]|uniref:hypothetical protein n=1 Tax=Acytostelium subglobosum LB1 TaxID=1410327 RepID=UPI000644E1CB|nr:hypothetical protein SAMD00019534_090080 [Acytostelium subglobosum LB1]GAM25833.1 hypothetical protein SAMD00019534_090080 [Acytostelium subglobosum LB1]|eukprot:XP_012751351.1 hypothetical protein SAMD00019534_090080 [Acytostelium subglobosum LB1]
MNIRREHTLKEIVEELDDGSRLARLKQQERFDEEAKAARERLEQEARDAIKKAKEEEADKSKNSSKPFDRRDYSASLNGGGGGGGYRPSNSMRNIGRCCGK